MTEDGRPTQELRGGALAKGKSLPDIKVSPFSKFSDDEKMLIACFLAERDMSIKKLLFDKLSLAGCEYCVGIARSRLKKREMSRKVSG
jgi:hypothetical protein